MGVIWAKIGFTISLSGSQLFFPLLNILDLQSTLLASVPLNSMAILCNLDKTCSGARDTEVKNANILLRRCCTGTWPLLNNEIYARKMEGWLKHFYYRILSLKKPQKHLNFGTIDQSAASIQFDSQSKVGLTFRRETFLV